MTPTERYGVAFAVQAFFFWFLAFLSVAFPPLLVITIPWAISLRRQWRRLRLASDFAYAVTQAEKRR